MSYVRTMGMGDAASTARNIGTIGSVGAAGAVALLGTFGLSNLVPIVGPALGAAIVGIQMLVANSGCGQTCIVTSQWANQAAQQLQTVLDAYFALPAPRTQSQQNAAITAFNAVWETLKAQCGQPGTGNAGVRCITDRQAGACTWRQKYAPTYPGQPNIGECWNWFNGYLKPIQNDRVVADPATSVSQSIDSIFGGASSSASGSSILPVLVVLGLLGLAVKL